VVRKGSLGDDIWSGGEDWMLQERACGCLREELTRHTEQQVRMF
jgi:hypothetical protein